MVCGVSNNMTRLLLALLVTGLLWASPAAAQVAVSSQSQVYGTGDVVPFKCAFNAIAATLTQCQAAPAAGLKIYIRTLMIQTTTVTSGTYAVQSGTGVNCVTGTAGVFPQSSTTNRFNAPITSQAMAVITFDPPLDLPAASAACVIGVATNTVSGQMAGFIAQ